MSKKRGPAKGTKQNKTVRGHILTTKRLEVLKVWKGNLTEACAAAGYKQPHRAATQLAKDPEFMKALKQKQETFISEMTKIEAQTAGEFEGLKRGERRAILAEIARNKEYAPAARVAAVKLDAELNFELFKAVVDMSPEFENRSIEELEYFRQHGYFAETKPVESAEPGPDHISGRSNPPD